MTQPYPDHIRLGPGEDSVILLDQTQLPNRLEERQVRSLAEMIEAIRSLRVRGAPAIGIFAGYCLYALSRQLEARGWKGPALLAELEGLGAALAGARPTAVSLSWAVDRMLRAARGSASTCRRRWAGSAGPSIRRTRICATKSRSTVCPFYSQETGYSPTATPALWLPPAMAPPLVLSCWPRSAAFLYGYSRTRPGLCSRELGSPPGSFSRLG